jgi:hypothetical protein
MVPKPARTYGTIAQTPIAIPCVQKITKKKNLPFHRSSMKRIVQKYFYKNRIAAFVPFVGVPSKGTDCQPRTNSVR